MALNGYFTALIVDKVILSLQIIIESKTFLAYTYISNEKIIKFCFGVTSSGNIGMGKL